MLTRRGFGVLFLPLPVLAASALWPWLVWLAAGMAVLGIAAVIADVLRTSRAHAFDVRRHHDAQLILGIDNVISLLVTQSSGRATTLLARDEFPHEWQASTLLLDARHLDPPEPAMAAGTAVGIKPGHEAEFRYTVHPPRRGDYAFGDTHLRWTGPWGLIVRQTKFASAAAIKIYPNLQGARKYDLLVKRGRMVESGLRTVRHAGDGSDFERLRDFLPDDQVRMVDWRATARRHKLTVRQLQAERSQNILALIDAGRLMQAPGDWTPEQGRDAPNAALQKIDFAVNAALMLSYVAGQRGDRVGVLAFAAGVLKHLPPKSGRAQFYRMLDALYDLQAQPVESDYARAFAHLATVQRKRALVVVFTDLQSGIAAKELVERFAPLRRHHLTLFVTMSDAGVSALTRAQPASIGDVYTRTVAEQMLDERGQVLQTLGAHGILTLDVPADQLSLKVVNRYLELKAKQVL